MRTLTIFIAFLMIAGCRVGNTQNQSPVKTMVLKSVGEIETLPDMATFQINLSCLETTVLESKECLVEKSNTLDEQLRGFGIAPKDLLTTAVRLNKKYRWSNGEQQFIGYESSTSITVTVRSLDSLSLIYSTLLENKNLDLGGLSYSHSDMDGLKNKAHADALAKANSLADELLAQLPETEKEIVRIGNVAPEVSLPVYDAQRNLNKSAEYSIALSEEPGDVPINKGTLRIYAVLFVEYQIR